jgi:hypothetical protein
MRLPKFTADRSLAAKSRAYSSGVFGRKTQSSARVVAQCSGVECHGTNESCCCPSKCVVSGLGCHCDQAVMSES